MAGSRPGGPFYHILPSLCMELCCSLAGYWMMRVNNTRLAVAVAVAVAGLPPPGLLRSHSRRNSIAPTSWAQAHQTAQSSIIIIIIIITQSPNSIKRVGRHISPSAHHGLANANTSSSSSSPHRQAPLHRSKSCNCLKQDGRRRRSTTTSAEPDTSRDTG